MRASWGRRGCTVGGMTQLTPEERARIAEEEKVRLETQSLEKGRATGLGCLSLASLIGVVWLLGDFVGYLPWLLGGVVLGAILGSLRGWFGTGTGWLKFTVVALGTSGWVYLLVKSL